MFSDIVVGTDGSETAKLAVRVAADLAEKHDAVLHLVNAYKVPSGGPGRVQVEVASEEASAEVHTTLHIDCRFYSARD